MIRFILLIFLIGIPIAEVAVIVMVGSIIGALPTIAIIILTAILGAALLKRQGLSAINRVRSDIRNNKVPAGSIGEAFAIALAGILLLTPGFITDTVGFALFVPKVRQWLGQRIAGVVRVDSRGFSGGPQPGWQSPRGPQGPKTIDLDEGEYSRGADPSSPWHEEPRR